MSDHIHYPYVIQIHDHTYINGDNFIKMWYTVKSVYKGNQRKQEKISLSWWLAEITISLTTIMFCYFAYLIYDKLNTLFLCSSYDKAEINKLIIQFFICLNSYISKKNDVYTNIFVSVIISLWTRYMYMFIDCGNWFFPNKTILFN